MGKIKNNNDGFSAVETVLVLVIVVLIGVVGWMVYKSNHKAPQPVTASTTKATPPKTVHKTADIYTGWKSYTLKYEKLNFKYPSAWSLKDTTSNQSDRVELTGANGFTLSISTGGLGHPSSEISAKVIKAEPITLAGQSTYLDYSGGTTFSTQDDGLVYAIYVSKSSTKALDAPLSKNPGENSGSSGNMLIQLDYGLTGKSLADVLSDQNIIHAKHLIASMQY